MRNCTLEQDYGYNRRRPGEADGFAVEADIGCQEVAREGVGGA